jgi:hypothetical protein
VDPCKLILEDEPRRVLPHVLQEVGKLPVSCVWLSPHGWPAPMPAENRLLRQAIT